MKLRLLLALFAIGSFYGASCGDDNTEPALTASFNTEMVDANHVKFINTTQQEYSIAEWVFGNGTTAKDETEVTVFYPSKGDYTAKLDVWKSGTHSQAIKTITITEDAFSLQLQATPKAGAPNYIQFSCNTILTDIKWDFGARGSSNSSALEVYFPFSGNYTIPFSAKADGVGVTGQVSFQIASDDANYINNHQLVWQDEFDGTAINTDKWLHETGASGWGNAELENYTNGENTTVSGGTLKITAKKVGPGQNVGDYTSSRINSKEAFLYGRMEFRAKMPTLKGKGLWPALWMLGKSIQQGTAWPDCGEIDIMEYISAEPHKVMCTIHSKANNHSIGTQISTGWIEKGNVEDEFRVYGILWSERYMKFYLDSPDNVVLTFARPVAYTNDNWPFDKPFYFLMNLAVGGMFGGTVDDTIFPNTFEIDYVKVYQHPDYKID